MMIMIYNDIQTFTFYWLVQLNIVSVFLDGGKIVLASSIIDYNTAKL